MSSRSDVRCCRSLFIIAASLFVCLVVVVVAVAVVVCAVTVVVCAVTVVVVAVVVAVPAVVDGVVVSDWHQSSWSAAMRFGIAFNPVNAKSFESCVKRTRANELCKNTFSKFDSSMQRRRVFVALLR